MVRNRRSTVPALIFSSLTSSAVVAGIAAVASSNNALMTFAAWLALGFVANLILASTVGLAWHTFAYRRVWTGLVTYIIPAALLGAIIPILLFGLPPILAGNGLDFHSAAFVTTVGIIVGVLLGALTGLFAWLARRPDRDAPNPPTPAA